MTVINTWAVAIFRDRAGIIQWKASELKIWIKTKKNHENVWSVTSKVDRLYVEIKQGEGRGLISVERCIREIENSLGFYVANSEENLITGVFPAYTINTRETITSVEFKKQKVKEPKEKWREKRMDGKFVRETTEKGDKEKTWQWLSRGHLKVETEALLCSTQEQADRINYMK